MRIYSVRISKQCFREIDGGDTIVCLNKRCNCENSERRKMYMNKFKRIIALLLMVSMVTLTTVSVKAASSVSGGLGGYTIYGCSSITASSAYGTTYCTVNNPSIYVQVTFATYICIKPYTSDTVTLTGSSSGYSTTTKTFYAPDDYRSSSIACSHSASLGSGTWSDSTSAVY